MRREEIVRGVSRIVNDFKRCGLLETFETVMEKFRHNPNSPKEGSSIPLNFLREFFLATQDYGDSEITICDILGLSDILEVGFWESAQFPTDPERIFRMNSNVRFAMNNLPKLLLLFEQKYVQSIKEHKKDIPDELKNKTIVTVIIIEDERQFSKPQRLTHTLEAIVNLYSVCATLENENDSDLTVLACDSGSDKSFDFLGLAKLMEQVKEILIAIWDRRVFHRQRQMSECLSLIAESLPIIERIEQLKSSGAIAPEQAEIMKRKTIDGATKFMQAGATIPELETESNYSPRQLMKPEQKLLAFSAREESDQTIPITPPNCTIRPEDHREEDLSAEELQVLDTLLKKAKQKQKKKST